MAANDDHIEETTEEARQAVNVKGMTTVLGLSITGVVIVLGLGLIAFLAVNSGWL